MPAKRLTPKAAALAWWKERVDQQRYVVLSAESRSAATRRFLRANGLVLEVAGGRVWILTEPDQSDPRGVFLRNYWAVVAQVMASYPPSQVAGATAVGLHLGELTPPTLLTVEHAANQSRYLLPLFAEFALQLHPTPVNVAHQMSRPAQEATITVLRPAHLLTTLDLTELDAAIEPIGAWMRHLVVRTPELEEAVEARPRPLVLTRLRDLAITLRNTPLATQLTRAIEGIATRPPSRAATGVGARVRVPAVLAEAPRGSDRPWLDRQRMTLEKFCATLDPLFSTRVPDVQPLAMAQRLTEARYAKQYDTYHNTTMEGYRISKDASDAVVAGTYGRGEALSPHELRAVMAVQGYSNAFDHVMEWLRDKSPRPVTEGAILDLHVALFQPSVDAEIVTAEDLRRWRGLNVGLMGGWRHVPPSHEKVPSLIDGLCRFMSESAAAASRHPVTTAVLVQLDFVTTHPFLDGNGRLSRLLMNYLLVQRGYPWITIRADERQPYFRALEAAQVEGDVLSLGDFMAHHVRLAMEARNTRSHTRGTRQRIQ